jgi:AcrR family transcriptional regulator
MWPYTPAMSTSVAGSGRASTAKGEERRQRVLEAALATITERGIPGTRMADIAARAGMSPGHVLYYFRSKTHILAEVLRWNEDDFHDRLRAKLRKTRTARGRVMQLLRSSVPDGKADPHWLLWLQVWAMSPHDRELLQDQEDQDRRFQTLLAGVIEEGQRSGEFDATLDAAEAAIRLSALIDGLAIHVATGARLIDRAAMLRIATSEAESLLGFRAGPAS